MTEKEDERREAEWTDKRDSDRSVCSVRLSGQMRPLWLRRLRLSYLLRHKKRDFHKERENEMIWRLRTAENQREKEDERRETERADCGDTEW